MSAVNPEMTTSKSQEFIEAKMQRPLYVCKNGALERRHIGSTNIFATHGMAIDNMAALARSGEFSGNDPILDDYFFLTPNLRNKSWKQTDVYGELQATSANIEDYNPIEASEIYADRESTAADGTVVKGGFIVAFGKQVIKNSRVVEVDFDATNLLPEIAIKPKPNLDAIFKIYPIDDQSIREYQRLIQSQR